MPGTHRLSVSPRAPQDCNYDMAETGKVRLYVEVYDHSGGVEKGESGWSSWVGIG